VGAIGEEESKSTMGEMQKPTCLLHAARNLSKNDKFTSHDTSLPANFCIVVEALIQSQQSRRMA